MRSTSSVLPTDGGGGGPGISVLTPPGLTNCPMIGREEMVFEI
jgi:hypothetical protein